MATLVLVALFNSVTGKNFGDALTELIERQVFCRVGFTCVKESPSGRPQYPSQETEAPLEPTAEKSLTRAEENALAPRNTFRECRDCPEMIVVPAGTFYMGSSTNELWRRDNEGPIHAVRIGKPFAVGKYEITYAEFAAFVDATRYRPQDGCEVSPPNSGPAFARDRSWTKPDIQPVYSHPVVCVNTFDAAAYTRWLSDRTGREYRLLSEAEWEYVARAGTNTAYYFGSVEADICKFENVFDETARQFERTDLANYMPVVGCTDGFQYIAPVGSYPANPFGIFDIIGNVHEIVSDCYHDDYRGAPSRGETWLNAACAGRVFRGGSWGSIRSQFRIAHRGRITADHRSTTLGFRVARSLN